MISHGLDSKISTVLHNNDRWLTQQSVARNVVFLAIFISLTAGIVVGGVSSGIESGRCA